MSITKISAAMTDLDGAVTINESSADADFRVESDGDANMLVVDGGNNRVGVGTSPDYRMHIFTSDSSAGAHANADDLFIENSSNAGMTIGSGTSSKGSIFFSDSDSSLSGQIEYRHSDDSLMLITGGSNRLHIQADGDLDIIDGNLIVASGHGIDFAASANASGAASHLLDDYEEGTWTPAVAAGGWSIDTTSSATYTKIGRVVHIHVYTSITGTGNSDDLVISGLPFDVPTNMYAVNKVDAEKVNTHGAYVRAAPNTDDVNFLTSEESTSSGRTNLDGNEFGAGYLIFSITYFAS